MQFIKPFTRFVSGSDKVFELYHLTVVKRVEEYYTTRGKHMMRAMVDGRFIPGVFNQAIFDIIKYNLNTPAPFLTYRFKGSTKNLMIAALPHDWQVVQVKFLAGAK